MLNGLGRQTLVFWLAILGFWILGVPLGAILTFVVDLGVVGLWWGFAIGVYLTSIFGIWCLHRVDWDHEAKRTLNRLSSVMSTRLDSPSVELLFSVQQFVVPVQQTLADQGLRVPTLTTVVE